ncbi:hypothetical protein BCR41DRAFT_400865 [Lobosporangium transversale]|uniref:Uncharacterized protein n=1 Tax=Lobosporangium transversale TaxID=64571 RepID=A0A1Y2GBF8_9FUNG|nr:hypothetical protein BCR41DRAFT_400865 [Lobosporangium transversale]ORZ04845.1 hypothetical protein BCR41DRAFT_400865 [Lobosporangium transversale]|eukprot:XP_021876782.1 hypothetical protein BCR41DRAFT_400865 [Lobosporangium transversale]
MTFTDVTTSLQQAFIAVSGPDFRPFPSIATISYIQARADIETGQYVIMWEDIQQVFDNAKYLRVDAEVIPFITDQNSKDLVPLRVQYRPGVTLQVVVRAPDHANVPSKEIKEAMTEHFSQQRAETEKNQSPSAGDFSNAEANGSCGIPTPAGDAAKNSEKCRRAVADAEEVG